MTFTCIFIFSLKFLFKPKFKKKKFLYSIVCRIMWRFLSVLFKFWKHLSPTRETKYNWFVNTWVFFIFTFFKGSTIQLFLIFFNSMYGKNSLSYIMCLHVIVITSKSICFNSQTAKYHKCTTRLSYWVYRYEWITGNCMVFYWAVA